MTIRDFRHGPPLTKHRPTVDQCRTGIAAHDGGKPARRNADVGEALPLTHFLRIVRGIMLKGNGLAEILPEIWPIALFMILAGAVALKRYRQTLD